MEKPVNEPIEKNVFIFNQIVGNENCVKRLCATFEEMGCSVECHQYIDYAKFKKNVNRIVKANFACWNYVVIIILDNQNIDHRAIYMYKNGENNGENNDEKTEEDDDKNKDKKYLGLNSYLITRIQENESLGNRKLLIILQNNHTIYDSDEDEDDHVEIGQAIYSSKQIYHMDKIEISAVSLFSNLDDKHWQQPNAAVSPFIRIFCEQFVDSETKPMSEIIANIRKDYNTEEVSLHDSRNVSSDFILGPARRT